MQSISKARILASIMVLASATAATLLMASPAAAAISGRIIYSATTATDLTSPKQIYVGCPAGMAALGGGAVIVGGNGVVHLTANVPTPVSDGHTARAVAYPGFRGGVWVDATPWRLTAQVICAFGVTGRDVVYAGAIIGAGMQSGSVTVSCPAGKKVIGMGGYVGDKFILSSVFPNFALTSVTAMWARPMTMLDSVTTGTEAWAVCIDPTVGMEVAGVTSASNSDNTKVMLVTCPSGKLLYDVGGGVTPSSPQREVKVDMFNAGTTNAAVSTTEMVYQTPANWSMFARGICA